MRRMQLFAKRKLRPFLCLIIPLVGIGNSFSQIEIMNHFEYEKDNEVGFKEISLIDYSRKYGAGFRVIQMAIWYPTDESRTKMDYYDYLHLHEVFVGKGKSLDSLIEKEVNRLSAEWSGVELNEFKNLKTIAQRSAKPKNGSFPVLLFAPGGNSSAFVNSVLCEYLASHGFIVIAFPSIGDTPGERWPFDQTGLELHSNDMNLIIKSLPVEIPQADLNRVGLLAWSVGGVSQVYYYVKYNNIDMLISIDSGIGRKYGVEMIKESGFNDLASFTVPFLHFTGEAEERFEVERSTVFFDSITSKSKKWIAIKPFAHQHFTSSNGFIPALIANNEVHEDFVKSYIHMSKLILLFAEIHLKGNIESEKKWKEIEGF